MKKIYLSELNPEELLEAIRLIFKEENSKYQLQNNALKNKYGSRQEVAKTLKISLPTLHEFTKKGILKAYKIGGRVLYKWDQIEKVLNDSRKQQEGES
jgi:excisionase family DNA binding protein